MRERCWRACLQIGDVHPYRSQSAGVSYTASTAFSPRGRSGPAPPLPSGLGPAPPRGCGLERGPGCRTRASCARRGGTESAGCWLSFAAAAVAASLPRPGLPAPARARLPRPRPPGAGKGRRGCSARPSPGAGRAPWLSRSRGRQVRVYRSLPPASGRLRRERAAAAPGGAGGRGALQVEGRRGVESVRPAAQGTCW